MTIEEMKQKKKERGYSYELISVMSGVPFSTVRKVFKGITTRPRYDTLCMLQEGFALLEASYETENTDEENIVCEAVVEYGEKNSGEFNIEDYYALPDDTRVELIDGVFYDMVAPSGLHQELAGEIYRQIANFIIDRKGKCKAFISPIDVQLDCDNKTMVQPDVIILCNESKNINRCIYGAPDYVLEVVSKSTRKKDYTKKLQKYKNAGVREYWILDPFKRILLVYNFEKGNHPIYYKLNQPVAIAIYNGKLKIDFAHINMIIDKYENYLN